MDLNLIVLAGRVHASLPEAVDDHLRLSRCRRSRWRQALEAVPARRVAQAAHHVRSVGNAHHACRERDRREFG